MIAVLERKVAQLRHLQRHFAGPGVQLPLIAARPCVLAVFASLVLPRSAQMIRLRIQQRVQRLFHRRPYHLVQMRTNLPVVDLNHRAKRLAAPLHPRHCFHRRLHHKSLRGLAPPACTNRLRQNSNQMCERYRTLSTFVLPNAINGPSKHRQITNSVN